jgi:hypothetical protein
MTKFKIGDRVRRIGCPNAGDGWVLNVGDTCTVIGLKTVFKEEQWLNLGHITDRLGGDKTISYEGGGHNGAYFELVTQEASTNHRTNDVVTSVAAAKAVRPKKASIKAVILDLLDKYKTGLTGQEIAEYSGLRLNSVTPRFAELSRWGGSPFQKTPPVIMNTNRTRSGQIVWVLYEVGCNNE